MSEKQQEALKQSYGALKKILAAGAGSEKDATGAALAKLKGAFYYSFRKDDHALTVSLSRRDPTGKKTRTRGKALRKELQHAKFCWGTVEWSAGKRPLFTLYGGNASKAHLRKGLRLGLANNKELKLGFLKKCIIREQEDAGIDAEDDLANIEGVDDAEIEHELELSDEERTDLEDILSDQGRLGAANTELDDALAHADSQAETDEVVLEIADRIAQLRAANAPAEEINEQYWLLAEARHTGPTPEPEVGKPLQGDVKLLVQAAQTQTSALILKDIERLISLIEERHTEVEEMSDTARARVARTYTRELEAAQGYLRANLERLEALTIR